MKTQSILLRYHEIAIKGDNRNWFEKCLVQNIKKTLQRTLGQNAPIDLQRIYGRILLNTEWNSLTSECLQKIFGISNFSPIQKVQTNLDSILLGILNESQTYITENGYPQSFRIKTRRSEKALEKTSAELNQYFGSEILKNFPAFKVDLKNPELTLGIEIRRKESFIWSQKILGSGGLPVGTQSPVLALLSGGLDSPVAAIQIMKRGSPTSYIHFYGTPFVGKESLQKIENLVRVLNRYQPSPQPLYIIPFGSIQEKIAQVTQPKFRTILYRRMMIRISNEIALKIKAKALLTGESVGQVASQTIENISTIESVSQIPIFRPFVASNKDEIITKAKIWGTYCISIQPALDCCTLFADHHPALHSELNQVQAQEKLFSVQELMKTALQSAEMMIL